MPEYSPPADGRFASILVPTVDTTRYAWLLNTILMNNKPVMFCGFSGAAKTVTVQSGFSSIPQDEQKYMFLKINFSSRTTSMDLRDEPEDTGLLLLIMVRESFR